MFSDAIDSVKNYFNYENLQKTWSYGGRSLLLTRYILSAISKGCPQPLLSVCPQKIDRTVTYLKLAAIVGVPFSIVNGIRETKALLESKNKELIAVRTFTVSLTISDCFDSITTFVNAILTLCNKTPILSSTAIPLALWLNAGSAALRVYGLCKTWNIEGEFSSKYRRYNEIMITASGISIAALALFSKGVKDARPAALMALATLIRLVNVPPEAPVRAKN